MKLIIIAEGHKIDLESYGSATKPSGSSQLPSMPFSSVCVFLVNTAFCVQKEKSDCNHFLPVITEVAFYGSNISELVCMFTKIQKRRLKYRKMTFR